jgi:hypothetical protein
MDLNLKIEALLGKDTKEAYSNLLLLEQLSETTNKLYHYFYDFFEMIYSEKYAVRIRGYRLLCKQAKWDSENKINAISDELLTHIEDEKPTAIRQKIKSLEDIVPYKKELNDKIKQMVLSIDCSKFKDTMSPLIVKDIQNLVSLIEAQ